MMKIVPVKFDNGSIVTVMIADSNFFKHTCSCKSIGTKIRIPFKVKYDSFWFEKFEIAKKLVFCGDTKFFSAFGERDETELSDFFEVDSFSFCRLADLGGQNSFLFEYNNFIMPINSFVDRYLFFCDGTVKVFACECHAFEYADAVGQFDSDTSKWFWLFYMIACVVWSGRSWSREERIFSRT